MHRSPSDLQITFSLLDSDHLTSEPVHNSLLSTQKHSQPHSPSESLYACHSSPSTQHRHSISSNNTSIRHTHIWMPEYTKYLDVDQHIIKKGWNTHVTWACAGPNPYIIQLEHGLIFGTRRITVNGSVMITDRKVLDDGSVYHLTLQGYDVVIQIITEKGSFRYQLSIDGQVAKEWQ
jgi:hypothetical protein